MRQFVVDAALAQRQAFFCFVFFVATKKMTLLSGNPDGFPVAKNRKASVLKPHLKFYLVKPANPTQ
jgi:hypothetical protein